MISVSAVVSAHNEEQYIAGCLESILAQTYPVDEVIVIDDRSTDRTQEIALRYPVTVYKVDYGNTYLTKREGIFVAKNDIILSVDGDTYLAPDFLARGMAHMGEGYKSATGYVYPHDVNPASMFCAGVCNACPPEVYYSGPGYVVDRRAYKSSCRIVDLGNNILVDHCMDLAEIPLDASTTIKDPEMRMQTKLPSTGQKRTLLGAGVVSGIISALILI